MSLMTRLRLSPWIGFPRVSGDEPRSRDPRKRFLKFSPRERG